MISGGQGTGKADTKPVALNIKHSTIHSVWGSLNEIQTMH